MNTLWSLWDLTLIFLLVMNPARPSQLIFPEAFGASTASAGA